MSAFDPDKALADDPEIAAYDRGYQEGFDTGYSVGYDDGADDAYRSIGDEAGDEERLDIGRLIGALERMRGDL